MKINLGSHDRKKSLFPISLDSSSTSNFGEVLPFFCYEAVANSHVNVKLGQAVRFSPLSFPTFGKADLKSYIFAHKISELFPPFNDMLAQTPYTAYSGTTYVPSEVPSLPLFYLWLSVFCQGSFNFYFGTGENYTGFDEIGVNIPDFSPLFFSAFDFITIPRQNIIANGFHLLDKNGDYRKEAVDSVSSSLVALLMSGVIVNPLVKNFLTSLFPKYDSSFAMRAWEFLQDVGTTSFDQIVSNFRDNSFASEYDGDLDVGSCDLLFPISVIDASSSSGTAFLAPGFKVDYSKPDPVYSFNSNAIMFDYEPLQHVFDDDSINAVFVGVRLNNSGKFLRKLFMGLGYQLAPMDTKVSILPLFAYFKSYFEQFAPKRFVKFDQTSFSKLINFCVNTGFSLEDAVLSNDSYNHSFYDNLGWSDVIDDLLSCFYTKNTDYYSSQIVGMINNYGSDLSQSYTGVNDTDGVDVMKISSNVSKNEAPGIDFDSTTSPYPLHTQAQQNILNRLTQFVNRRSAAGGKLSALLSSVFGIAPKDVDKDANPYFGSHVLDVNISDVFSTAETEQGALGEYAGKAMAFGSSDTFNIEYDCPFIVVGVQCVVPRTQYVNGLNPQLTHCGYHDFYNPMYDGLTLLPTRSSSLFVPNGYFAFNDKSFGNAPLYSEYKMRSQGILSGDLSLRSTRSSFDSFTMDEVLDGYSVVQPESTGPAAKVYEVGLFFPNLACGTMWRYLGRWLWLGRFDRIFVNNRLSYTDFVDYVFNNRSGVPFSSVRDSSRSDDNLVVHNIVDLKVNAPMISPKDSWMTQDLDTLSRDGLTIQGE